MSHSAYFDSLQYQEGLRTNERISHPEIRNLYREHFLIWMFLSQEGLWEEAREFLRDNEEEQFPSNG